MSLCYLEKNSLAIKFYERFWEVSNRAKLSLHREPSWFMTLAVGRSHIHIGKRAAWCRHQRLTQHASEWGRVDHQRQIIRHDDEQCTSLPDQSRNARRPGAAISGQIGAGRAHLQRQWFMTSNCLAFASAYRLAAKPARTATRRHYTGFN